MLSEHELLKLELNVLRIVTHRNIDNPSNGIDREAVQKTAEKMKAAAMLGSVLNQSVAKYREQMKDTAGPEFKGLEGQIKAALLKAQMDSTGKLWLQQMLILYLKSKFEAEAYSESVNKDQQTDTNIPENNTPEDAANRISKHAVEHKVSKANALQVNRKNRKVITSQLGLSKG